MSQPRTPMARNLSAQPFLREREDPGRGPPSVSRNKNTFYYLRALARSARGLCCAASGLQLGPRKHRRRTFAVYNATAMPFYGGRGRVVRIIAMYIYA